MKIALKYSFILPAAVIGTFKLSSPCNAKIVVEEEDIPVNDNVPGPLQDESKLMNLRGAVRSARATTTTTTTTELNSHDDLVQVARKLQAATNLTSGETLTGLSGDNYYSKTYFALRNVSDARVTCTTTGGAGNVNMKVMIGEMAQFPYCNLRNTGNIASCTTSLIVTPTDILIELFGYEAYTGATLTCFPAREIKNGIPLTGLSGDIYSHSIFAFRERPFGERIIFVTSGGTGDVDMFVKVGDVTGSAQLYFSADCKSIRDGNNNSCAVGPISTPNYVFIDLFGWIAYTGVTLTCYVVKDLLSRVTVNLPYAETGSHQYFAMRQVPARMLVVCTTTGVLGDVDLSMKKGDLLQISSSPDCKSSRVGNGERCVVRTASRTDVFIDLYSKDTYVGARLTCSLFNAFPTKKPTNRR